MTQSVKVEVHPLFDPSSHYRACSQESVWVDGGVKSIQDYFLQLHRDRLREAWQEEVPAEAQDWGYTPEVNNKVHQILRHRLGPVEVPQEAEEELVVRGGGASEAITPALVRFDLGQPWAKVEGKVLRSPRNLFTGIDTKASPDWNIKDSRFEVAIGGLPPRHHCVCLLLDERLLQRVAVALKGETPEAALGNELRVLPALGTEDHLLETIRAALSPEKLQPAADADWAAHNAASRLAMLLSLAPGLEGATNEEGSFLRTVELGSPRPYLILGTFLACCIGPAMSA
jgi:hypothetical protein